ncbi:MULTISPECIES: DUF2800 domain-containing protein [Megasphaera]|jgi:hypothetical protein|uniref:DUF2800 domain-containing protein n=1 Tax=Megasphaera TaxID=906 RepID=UPI00094439A0|nr:DUF2800 domain-containing protein [Megasphaera elsdenii]
MSRQHALLSASASARWLQCTAAPQMEAKFPDTTSEFAREGTLAHSIAELKLRAYAVEPMAKSTYTRHLNKFKKDELYQPEMDTHTETYLDYIKGILLSYKTKPYTVVEKRVDFSQYVPRGFGTADCLIMAPNELHIVDFKYGKGVPVDANNNSQMRLYALGALNAYQLLYQFKTVHMHIVQPRIQNFSQETLGVDILRQWAEDVVKPKAQEALSADGGKFHPGECCRFCRAKAQCKARAEYYAAMADTAHEKRDMTMINMTELGQYLTIAKQLKAWADDLQEYGLSCALKGLNVPGWKCVEGRGSRAFTDTDAAFKTLIDNGIDESVLYERVPLTLAKTEKAIGKKLFTELVGDYVEKKPGKPTLAPESDKRPPMDLTPKAADVFKKIDD